jgi:hypothetical protein
MSNPVGGSIESVNLDGRNFSVAADAGIERFLGGSKNEVKGNGDGTARLIKTRTPWEVTGFKVAVDDANGDQEFLQALADRNGFFPMSVTMASGKVYQGTAQITGDLKSSSEDATCGFDLSGPQKLTKQ